MNPKFRIITQSTEASFSNESKLQKKSPSHSGEGDYVVTTDIRFTPPVSLGLAEFAFYDLAFAVLAVLSIPVRAVGWLLRLCSRLHIQSV